MQAAETEFSTGKVRVTGTMDAEKLVDYVYRRTKKQAKIIPQAEPEPEPEKKEEEKEGGEKAAEGEAKAEEKKEEEKAGAEEGKKEGEGEGDGGSGENKEEKGSGEEGKEEGGEPQVHEVMNIEEEGMKRMMYQYYYQPLYVVEPIPPPQLFSDENPNACCIS